MEYLQFEIDNLFILNQWKDAATLHQENEEHPRRTTAIT